MLCMTHFDTLASLQLDFIYIDGERKAAAQSSRKRIICSPVLVTMSKLHKWGFSDLFFFSFKEITTTINHEACLRPKPECAHVMAQKVQYVM